MTDLTTDPLVARSASWERLDDVSAEAFVDALVADALAHPAIDHPYLLRLASGDLPDVGAALRDFCRQYRAYTSAFPSYLEAVIANLPDERHRHALEHNLEEERGHHDDAGPHTPHTELFARLRDAVGATADDAASAQPCAAALAWREGFLRACASKPVGIGLGAIGIGTEVVVSAIYRHLHTAVTRHTDLAPDDYLFLTLHIDCDDEHGDEMRAISVELAADREQREALRFGVFTALGLRSAFWDALLARALER